jgi:hypothetical protein
MTPACTLCRSSDSTWMQLRFRTRNTASLPTTLKDSIANTILGNFKDLPDGSQRLDMKRINWRDPEIQDQLAAMYTACRTEHMGQEGNERQLPEVSLHFG